MPVIYKQDNCRTNTPTDRQDSVLICLRNTTPLLALHCHPNNPVADTVLLPTQTTDRADTHTIYHRPNDRTDTPMIQRPINRLSSECSTYYHYLMLAPHCHQNWHLAALPAAAYLGTTILYFYNLSAAYLGITILHFYNLLATYSGTTILWFYFIID